MDAAYSGPTSPPAGPRVFSQYALPSPLPSTSTPIYLHDGRASRVTREQLDALRARAEQLGIGQRAQMDPPTWMRLGQSVFTANVAPARSASSSTALAPQPGTARVVPVAQSSQQPQQGGGAPQEPHAAGHPHASAPVLPQTPLDIIAAMPNMLNTMYAGLLQRMERTEEAVHEALKVPARLDQLEKDINERRDTHASFDNFTRLHTKRLAAVEYSIGRVADALGTSPSDELLPNHGVGHAVGDNTQKSLMGRLGTIECLLQELLEKANDPHAANPPVIRHEIGVNTDGFVRVQASVRCVSPRPPLQLDASVNTCAEDVNAEPEAFTSEEVSQDRKDPSPLEAKADADTPLSTAHQHTDPSDVRKDWRTNGGYQYLLEVIKPRNYLFRPGSDSRKSSQQSTVLKSPHNAPKPLQVATFRDAGLVSEALRPAAWPEVDTSELSSRSSSPGCTVGDLRAVLLSHEQRSHAGIAGINMSPDEPKDVDYTEPSASSSTASSVLPQAPTSSTPPSSPYMPLSSARPRFTIPVVASSRATSPPLSARSATVLSGESMGEVRHIPSPREDSNAAMAPEQQEQNSLTRPDSEDQADGPNEYTVSALSIPLRRTRSPSLESLSSLSSISSSPTSSVAVELALQPSSSSMVIPASVSAAGLTRRSRPLRKKRKTESLASSSTATTSKKGGRRRKKDAAKYPETEAPRWQVIQGYNGPCEWPIAILESKSGMNLIMCDQCECWYHWGCVGIGDNDPRAGLEEIDFTCPPCALSIEKHGVARKVRNKLEDCCARPRCDLNMPSDAYFLERLIARVPHNLTMEPPEFVWLFKWTGYEVRDATWEVDFPAGRDKFVKQFEQMARRQGLPVDDVNARIFLREAKEGGRWR